MDQNTPSCLASASLHRSGHIFKVTASGTAHQTDLVDDGKDGVDEHQVVLLERQVVGLLQGKQHRPYQGDLGGAGTNMQWESSYDIIHDKQIYSKV